MLHAGVNGLYWGRGLCWGWSMLGHAWAVGCTEIRQWAVLGRCSMLEMIHAGAGVHGGASGLCWGWWSMLEAVVHGVPCWEYWNVLGQWFMCWDLQALLVWSTMV